MNFFLSEGLKRKTDYFELIDVRTFVRSYFFLTGVLTNTSGFSTIRHVRTSLSELINTTSKYVCDYHIDIPEKVTYVCPYMDKYI